MNYYLSRFYRFIYEGAIPFTKLVLILSGLSFILIFFLNNIINLTSLLALIPMNLPGFFWTFLTYPLVNLDFLSLIFAGLWFWFVGGSLERTWGTRIYISFWVLVTLITGGAMALAAIFTKIPYYPIVGLWLPLVGITWAWAKVYPEREVMFWGIFPIKAIWLAWLHAGITFFNYIHVGNKTNVYMALAAISGIALVYLFGDTGRLGRGLRYRNWRREKSYPKNRRSRLRIIK
ncbi:MAG: rhomboid family intramembrane serine protease [Firmicutes bacterium]|nr:rhomboid family intramembrane serine protease [Bacillota bacterium]